MRSLVCKLCIEKEGCLFYNQEFSSIVAEEEIATRGCSRSQQPALRRSRRIMTSLVFPPVPLASCQIGCAIHVALVIEVVCGAEFGGRSRGCCCR